MLVIVKLLNIRNIKKFSINLKDWKKFLTTKLNAQTSKTMLRNYGN